MWNRLAAAGIAAAALTSTTPPPSTAPDGSKPYPGGSPVRIESCASGYTSFGFEANSVDPKPWPARVGTPVQVTVTGRVWRKILPGSTVRLRGWLGAAQVFDRTVELCGPDMVPCPLEPGQASFPMRFEVPSSMPVGVFLTFRAEFKNPDGSEMACGTTGLRFER